MARGSGVERVREALRKRGVGAEVVELSETARSAQDAADALGVRVEQIVKSLVFRAAESGRPVLVLAGGANRVDERRVSELLGEPIGKADAAFVREKTGFAIGGVPPVGHSGETAILVDEDLLREEEVWASAGHTHAVFGISPRELVTATDGRVAGLKRA